MNFNTHAIASQVYANAIHAYINILAIIPIIMIATTGRTTKNKNNWYIMRAPYRKPLALSSTSQSDAI